MKLYEELEWRGLIGQTAGDDIKDALNNGGLSFYIGVDPTGKSIHAGNLLSILAAYRITKAGNKMYILVGGATGMIGDPSGKNAERNLLDAETTKTNASRILNQLKKIFPEAEFVNNYDWVSSMNVITFLRDYGKNLTVNYMMAKESVKKRIETGISYTEFSYMILQSIDFLHLYETEGCKLQIGGQDQWGNLTSGLELIRKLKGVDAEAGCFTVPLLLDENGKKFGKSVDGALYLDRNLVSPYKIYQYFINTSDDDSARYYKVFSFKSIPEIEATIKEHYEKLGMRVAQKALAYEIVELIHGKEAADEVVKMSEALFSGNIKDLSEANIMELFGDLKVEVESGKLLEDVLIEIKAATSKREAREFIKGNSISLNGEKNTDLACVVDSKLAMFNKYIVVRRGKKNYYLVELH